MFAFLFYCCCIFSFLVQKTIICQEILLSVRSIISFSIMFYNVCDTLKWYQDIDVVYNSITVHYSLFMAEYWVMGTHHHFLLHLSVAIT